MHLKVTETSSGIWMRRYAGSSWCWFKTISLNRWISLDDHHHIVALIRSHQHFWWFYLLIWHFTKNIYGIEIWVPWSLTLRTRLSYVSSVSENSDLDYCGLINDHLNLLLLLAICLLHCTSFCLLKLFLNVLASYTINIMVCKQNIHLCKRAFETWSGGTTCQAFWNVAPCIPIVENYPQTGNLEEFSLAEVEKDLKLQYNSWSELPH